MNSIGFLCDIPFNLLGGCSLIETIQIFDLKLPFDTHRVDWGIHSYS